MEARNLVPQQMSNSLHSQHSVPAHTGAVSAIGEVLRSALHLYLPFKSETIHMGLALPRTFHV